MYFGALVGEYYFIYKYIYSVLVLYLYLILLPAFNEEALVLWIFKYVQW
jgi:hypothetical protein